MHASSIFMIHYGSSFVNILPLQNFLMYVLFYKDSCRLHNMWLDSGDWPKVTFGIFHFINSHTHTWLVYCCIGRLSWLVCFSGAGYADHVKSWLRQWGPWKALDSKYVRMCLIFTPALVRCLLGLLLGLTATPNSLFGICNSPLAAHPSPPPTHPLLPPLTPYTSNLWYYSCCEKSCSKSSNGS